MKTMEAKKVILFAALAVSVLTIHAHALIAELSTPAGTGGLESGGETWDAAVDGFKVVSEATNNGDGTWHYMYTFTTEDGDPLLSHSVSHFIISVSENFDRQNDIFNYQGISVDSGSAFGPMPGNPGLNQVMSPAMKLDLLDELYVVEFDSNRAPMWGDFYAKDGGDPKNYVYNADLGVSVADPYDYTGAKDASGSPLFKILVPDTIPEPATMALLGLGGLLLRKRKCN